jgi:hypothetical protein
MVIEMGRSPATEKLLEDIRRAAAESMTTGRFLSALAGSLLLIACGIFLLLLRRWLWGLLAIGFFGFCALASIKARRARRRAPLD